MSELGRALEEARLAKGLNRLQASKAIGLSDTHLKDIEKGHKSASESMLKRLTSFYGIEDLNSGDYNYHKCLDAVKALLNRNRDFIPALKKLASSKISARQLEQFIAINKT